MSTMKNKNSKIKNIELKELNRGFWVVDVELYDGTHNTDFTVEYFPAEDGLLKSYELFSQSTSLQKTLPNRNIKTIFLALEEEFNSL